tara:strand:- start:2986 stop:3303 length:318 start_codon:yes stop_codon:yes gene_type:complete
MINIQNLPFINSSRTRTTIDKTKFEYNRPLDPVQSILYDDSISKEKKIDKIQAHLVNHCGIIDGCFAKILALTTLGDKTLIKKEKKIIKKRYKKLNKKKNKKRKK